MSRKAIRRNEKIFSKENVKGIKKDQESGMFRIISQDVTREQVSGDIKSGKLVESEDLYIISSKSDFDVSFSYNDFETESKVTIYLKKSLP